MGKKAAAVRPFTTGDILYPLDDPLDRQSSIQVWDFGRVRFFRHGPDGSTELKKPPAERAVFVRPREGSAGRAQMRRAENILAAALERSSDQRMAVRDVRAELASKGFADALVDGFIRAFVANGTLTAAKAPDGMMLLRLSQSAREWERRRAYSASFANELASQAEQLGRLVGHGPTVGGEREELLRALLERHVPRRYHVATGFVDGFKCQCDILIYDQIDFAPLLRIGNLVVVPAEAVRAIIEVKSTLDAAKLGAALHHLDPLMFIAGDRPPIFKGVFAYQGIGPQAIAKGIRHHYRPITSENALDDDLPEPVVSIHQMVSAVCVLAKAMVETTFTTMPPGSDFPWMPATVILGSEAERESQAGAFFDLLDRFLRYPYEGAFNRSSLMDVVRNDMLAADVTALYDDEQWAGAFMLDDDGELMDDRIRAYRQWLDGDAWRHADPTLLI